MKSIQFDRPSAVEDKISEFASRFEIKPLERGFGTTLGNSLRRILLSSLPGTAIVNVQIDGVMHEFETIPGVTEDVMGIILNLKQVVFKTDSLDLNFYQKIELFAHNNTYDVKVVKAADFDMDNDLEIVNAEQVIAHLAPGAKLQLTAEVRSGKGYVSATQNDVEYKEGRFGVISIDSLFTPITRVLFNVETIRDGKDELKIEIHTNGAVEVKDAIAIAAKYLVDYLDVLVEASATATNLNFVRDNTVVEAPKGSDVSLETLELSVRIMNALKRRKIKTIAELIKYPEEYILSTKSLGKKSFAELKQKLAAHGYEFNPNPDKDFLLSLEQEEDNEEE